MCGSFGLGKEAELALDYTDEMTRINNRDRSTRVFRVIRGALGWKLAVGASERVRTLAKVVTGTTKNPLESRK